MLNDYGQQGQLALHHKSCSSKSEDELECLFLVQVP